MNTKVRLISTISAVCLILAMLVTGVWAVSTANVTLGGTVTFTADNIHATITGSITGTQETVTITPLVYDADSVPSDDDKATWNNDVNFGSGNLITMKVKVKNESTERSLFVKVTDNTTTSNITKTFTSTVTDVGSGDTYEVIKGGEIEYTLTLSVAELDYSASATYALDVELKDANYKEPLAPDYTTYSYLTFGSYNEDNGTVSVTGNSITTENFDLVIPEKISKDGKNYNVTSIGETAFEACSQIISVTIPDSVGYIGTEAFVDCNNLTTAVIGSGITGFGAEAMYGTGLKTVTIYATEVPSWASGTGTFPETLEYMYVPEESLADYQKSDGVSDYGNKNLTILAIGSTPETEDPTDEVATPTEEEVIAMLTFGEQDADAQTVTVTGNSITEEINLVIPEKVTLDGVEYTITKIKNNAFSNTTTIVSLTIPGSVTTVDSDAFAGCANLQTVIMKEGVQVLVDGVFYGCTNLKTVHMPVSITSIATEMFEETALTDIYYAGTESQWDSISISSMNDKLDTVTMHWSSTY